MSVLGIEAVANLGNGIVGLIDQYVEDKDKANQLKYETAKLMHDFDVTLLTTSTIPWVDALVKVLYACKQFLRPLGAIAMAAFGAYCATNNIALPEWVQVMLFGAPVGWGYSRHKNKQQAMRAKAAKPDVWTDEDEGV